MNSKQLALGVPSGTEKEALPVWMDLGYLQLYVPILPPLSVDKQSTEANWIQVCGCLGHFTHEPRAVTMRL